MLDTRSVAIVGPPAPDAVTTAPATGPSPRLPIFRQPERSSDEVETTVRRVTEQLLGVTPPLMRSPPALPEHKASYRRASGELFVNGVQPTDVTGGQANDCYLIALMSAIAATRPELIEQIVRPAGDGQFAVRFFDLGTGQPVRFSVDSALPYDRENNRPLYASSRDRELWGPIIEKAYAARYSGYGPMGEKGGVAQYAMKELTGFDAHTIRTASGVANTTRVMETAMRERRPMIAQVNGRTLSGCGVKKRGIVPDHSYAVLAVERVGGAAYVVLRDPMGASEYRTDKYDTDYALPGTRARRGDGVFRMRMDDFCRTFFNVVMMTDTPINVPSTYSIPPPLVETQTHIVRANPRPATPICAIPD